MSETVSEDIKRWTAKRKSALVIEIIQGKVVSRKWWKFAGGVIS